MSLQPHALDACRPVLAKWPGVRNRHFLLIDVLLLATAAVIALALRLDGFTKVALYSKDLALFALASSVLYLATFAQFGLYRRYWLDATVEELVLIFGAVLTGLALSFVSLAAAKSTGLVTGSFPQSIPLIQGLLLLVLIGGSRFSVRVARRALRENAGPDASRLLIVGAGFAGRWLARELQRTGAELGVRPIGFVDDDPEKQRLRIMNLPVLGTRADLGRLIEEHRIKQVAIAIPSAAGKLIREIVTACERAGVAVKTLPGLSAILDGKVLVSQMRSVDIEDLLRREPIETDTAAVRGMLRGQRVLVTGGGGSIGSELCRQILQCRPAELTVLGHGENSVFDIQNELLRSAQKLFGSFGTTPAIRAIIADIRFADRLQRVFEEVRPEIVFHAAAHKHVPLMEANPTEAIANNFLGTRNVLAACRSVGVQHFVMISTDKAVNPTSVMGASKRAAELLVLEAAQQTGMPYVAVRFGNVLGSRGSVVPTFKRQIAAGGPVTVSHPDMRRFFMTIPEAVQLVLQAAVLGRGGEVFMLDMGDPVKIVDLARDLIELSGLEVGRDIDIQITGIRPGEKLFEELYLPGERYERTVHDKILNVSSAAAAVPEELHAQIHDAQRAVREDDDALAVRILRRLVPEFLPDEVRREPQNGSTAVAQSPTKERPADAIRVSGQ